VKALVVRLSAVGDVIHTLPALAVLRLHGWDAGWVVESRAQSLLEGNPALNALTVVPRARAARVASARGAVAELKAARYDVALDFQGRWKSALWARVSGATRTLGYAGPWRRGPWSRLLLQETVIEVPDAPHVIDKNLGLLRALGIDAVGSREFPLPRSAAAEDYVRAGLAQLELGSFALLCPGGGWASKLWPPASFGALAAGLKSRGLASVVAWGPGEETLAERVVAASAGAVLKSFPTSLLELAELVRRARLVVAADTGPLHLACALRVPVVGLFGPTDPARNGPFAPDDVVVRRKPLCSPCHRRRCALHEGVMAAITIEEVQRAVDRRLGNERARQGQAV
jgi:lipopolysaccharide heptosyltransferase I